MYWWQETHVADLPFFRLCFNITVDLICTSFIARFIHEQSQCEKLGVEY